MIYNDWFFTKEMAEYIIDLYSKPSNMYDFLFKNNEMKELEKGNSILPVFTTDKFEEAGIKLEWDADLHMYVYREAGEDISEGVLTSYNDVWGLSPEMVEKYMDEGGLTTVDPTKPIEEKPVQIEEKCECDFDEEVETYLASDLLYRVASLEEKLDQVLELLNQKTKKK